MSTYTTTVQEIVEYLKGDAPSAAFGKLGSLNLNNTMTEAVLNQIFGDPSIANTDCFPIVGDDNDKRIDLERKILKHYYTREIGCETAQLWVMRVRNRMNEIMPYYNKLYSAELEVFNGYTIKIKPLNNFDLQITDKRDNNKDEQGTDSRSGKNDKTTTATDNNTSVTDTTTNVSGSTDSSTSGASSSNGTQDSRNSDTPQGTMAGVIDETYLTSVGIGKNTSSNSNSGESHGTSTQDTTYKDSVTKAGNANGTSAETFSNEGTNKRTVTEAENYVRSMIGKEGGESYGKLYKEFTEAIYNIDLRIINELKDLFMGVW